MKKCTILKDLFISGLSLCAVGVFASSPQKVKVATAESWAKSIVSQMTMEEKADFLCGSNGTTNNALGATGTTKEIARLGVRPIGTSDGPAGLRILSVRPADTKTYFATAFPIGTSLACTWNTDLVHQVGQAIGQEVKEYGLDVFLGPGVNIHRTPLCGRNFEYYSEDPYVVGNIAAAMINGIQSNGVGTSIKHFAANNQETNRTSINEIVSERAMREIYLRGFEIAIKKSQPWTVMSSYNKADGLFTSERHDMLTDILRGEWGFKGLVMSDWGGGFTGDNRSDEVAQIAAGNDLLMPGTNEQRADLLNAIKSGKLKMEIVDQAIERILKIVYQSPTQHNYVFSNNPDIKAHAALSRQAGAEGIVLLSNKDKSLPLTNAKNVALLGPASYNTLPGGRGSGDVNEAYVVSLNEGLKNAGFVLDEDLSEYYHAYQLVPNYYNAPKPDFNEQTLNRIAQSNDVAVITIARETSEGSDQKVEGGFNLTNEEQGLIENVSKAFHQVGKKVVVVLNIGTVIETESWKNKVDGILLAWQPGQEVGNCIADVLTGKVNPSGKLSMSFIKKYEDSSAAEYFPGEPANDPKTAYYKDEIFVGYRCYDKRNTDLSYEFGFGKSYTDFKYSDLKLNSHKFSKSLTATVTITNTGDCAGKEVAQLYLSAPKSELDKPVKELKGFAKTRLLQPGESQTLTFVLYPKDLASFNPDAEAWIADKGDYNIMIGASSRDVRLQEKFALSGRLVVEKVHPAFKQ